MRSGQLPQLIQGMYGAVLGVSIIRIFDNLPQGKEVHGIQSLNQDVVFQLFFCLFTLSIAAHDWYSFHRDHDIQKSRKFGNYFLQILSIFFIGQMFNFANISDFGFWYLVAAVYTVSNFIRAKYFEKESWVSLRYMYVHAGISVVGLFLGFNFEMNIAFKVGYLILTALVVIWIWVCRDTAYNKLHPKLGLEAILSVPEMGDGIYSISLTEDNLSEEKKLAFERFAVMSTVIKEGQKKANEKFATQSEFIEKIQKLPNADRDKKIREIVQGIFE